MSSKRNSTIEDSTSQLPPHEKTVTFIEIDGSTPAETTVADEHSNTQTKRLHSRTKTTRERSTIGGHGGKESTTTRGYNQYQSTTPSGDWRDTVKEMMSDL